MTLERWKIDLFQSPHETFSIHPWDFFICISCKISWKKIIGLKKGGKGGIKFYPYLYIPHFVFPQYRKFPLTKKNHLKFIQKPRDHKRKAKYNIGLHYFFCSGVMSLDLPKNIFILPGSRVIRAVWAHSSILFN